MLQTLGFSLQNAVYFIMLPFLVPVLFTLCIQVCQNLNVKLRCQEVKNECSADRLKSAEHTLRTTELVPTKLVMHRL